MTTVVTVKAHCSSDKEVVVQIAEHGTTIDALTSVIQDGESVEKVVYESRVLSVGERLKV